GLIFQSSELYGGLNGFWDYGPLGAELKRNIKDYWWRSMTLLREDVVGLEASIIMHPKIWEASGHTSTFTDLMVDCLLTNKRFRADQIEPQSGMVMKFSGAKSATGEVYAEPYSVLVPEGKPPESGRKVARRFSCSSRTCSKFPARKSPSASARSARRSATRSIPATSPSAPASSSRWNWNSSSSPTMSSKKPPGPWLESRITPTSRLPSQTG